MRRFAYVTTLALLVPQLASAQVFQDALTPVGPQAQHIHELWLLMLVVCSIVCLAIFIALAIALRRAPTATTETEPDMSGEHKPQTGATRSVVVALGLSTVALFGLLIASIGTDRALASLALTNALSIEVTAHQWWWEIRYDDPQPSRVFVTANELHIPVGRPVFVRLKSDDVIHSFWVPNLHGKKDLIPGRDATIKFRADRVGTFRGQCAEFCGYQHANMAFLVIAQSPQDYEGWVQTQLATAREPADDTQRRGQEVFLGTTCVMCHTIQGTQAQGKTAPDLTHLASRQTLAAGTLPNSRGHLAGWILDPQSIKPGVNMPANPLPAEDLHPLLAYLESLK
jgi:cytochrome c oxidase subunit 2